MKIKSMNMVKLLMFNIFFLLLLGVPVSATLGITCDKETYYPLSKFEALCQVNTTNSADLTVEFPSLVPEIQVDISVLGNVTREQNITDWDWGLFNSTCNEGNWSQFNLTDYYNCSNATIDSEYVINATLNCSSLYTNDTICEYNDLYISGYHLDTSYSDEYVAQTTEKLGKNNFKVSSIDSDYSNTYFKIKTEIPIGTQGKFNLKVETASDSGKIDPNWISDADYKRAIYAGCTACSSPVTMTVLINDPTFYLDGTPQYVWCNYTVPTTVQKVGYLYYDNETFYGCIDLNETEVTMDVDEGTQADRGNPWDANTLRVFHMNGTDVHDSSIYGISGTSIGGQTTVNGKIGSGLNFDAIDDYISLGYGTFDGQSSGTVMAWGYLNTDSGTHSFFTNRPGNVANYVHTKVYGKADPWGQEGLEFNIRSSGVNHVCLKKGPIVDANTWYHFAFRWGSGGVRIFFNGVEQSCYVCLNCNIPISLPSPNYEYRIGKQQPVTPWQFWWDGILDEYRIYNRSLSNDEIMAIYNNSVGTHNFSYLGVEEAVGYSVEFTKFVGGEDSITTTGNESTSLFVNPDINYSESEMNITGLPASPYPLNPRIYVAGELIFNYTGNFSTSQLVSFNVNIINNWLVDHPSGEVPVDVLVDNVDGKISLSDLSVKGVSPEPVIYCDGTEYYDYIDEICRLGSVSISTEKDKNYYAFEINATTSNWFTTDPFRWERENQSLPVIVKVDFKVPNHILNINESNARRVLIDFNKISDYTKYNIWNSITVRKDFYINIVGVDINDYIIVGIPEPRGVYKDMNAYYDWTYNSETKTLSIVDVTMSPHSLYLDFNIPPDSGLLASTPMLLGVMMSAGAILTFLSLALGGVIRDFRALIYAFLFLVIAVTLAVTMAGI